jgi:hypothetical protein
MQRGAESYGEHAVERMADELRVGPGVLYRSARVAQCWSAEQIKELEARIGRRGEPLSWSHLVVLAKVRGKTKRDGWATRCLEGGWTVRELAEAIADGTTLVNPEAAAEGEPGARIALREGMQVAARAATHFAVVLDALNDRLTDDVDDDLVAGTIAAYEKVHGTVVETLERLRDRNRPSGRRLQADQGPSSSTTRSGRPERAPAGGESRGRTT